jgi:hypothetical protein
VAIYIADNPTEDMQGSMGCTEKLFDYFGKSWSAGFIDAVDGRKNPSWDFPEYLDGHAKGVLVAKELGSILLNSKDVSQSFTWGFSGVR